MPSQLALVDLSKSYADRPVFRQVSLTIRPGELVGVVGDNGAGKSTLLRLIAGEEQPDDGEITVTTDRGVGLLGQTLDVPPDHTVGQVVDLALADLRDLERRIHEAEARLGSASEAELAAYGDMMTDFEAREGYRADAKVRTALNNLGLPHIDYDRTVGSLAGGEEARLALACLLASEPELLLLDEPTNHLDGGALDWLEERVRRYRGTVVAVSHDRTFLDRVTSAILEVDGDRHTVQRYGDGYSGYLAEKAAARRRWEERYQTWLDDIAYQERRSVTTAHRVAYNRRNHSNKLQFYGHGVRVERQVGSRVRNSLERLRRLRENPVPRPPDPLRFTGRPAGGETEFEGPLVRLCDATVDDRLAVDSLTISRGERLLVHGANGAGKSTLLDLIAGEVSPDAGVVERQGVVGYLPQEVRPKHARTPLLQAFAAGWAGTPEEHEERLRALGLFSPDDFHVPVGDLSVGQQRRLTLARMLVRPADLLLLDEPTNHLTPALLEELEEALTEYRGAVVIVTHDRRLRERFAGERREMRDGRLSAEAAADRG